MPDHETSAAPEMASAPPDWTRIGADILCPLCSYNLRGLTEPRCPECGYRFDWPEVLDPHRRLHPYLFEHHPERNFRSFCRTALGALRPIHFWTSLHPIQPSNRQRLVAYFLLGQFLYVLVLLTATMWGAYAKAQANNAVMARYTANLTARFQSLPASEQQRIIQQYGSRQAWITAMASVPTTTTMGILRQELSNSDLPAKLAVGVALPLGWPWLTYLALRIFAISMRRAQVDKTHVFRCIVYSLDLAIWVALYVGAATAAGFLLSNSVMLAEIIIFVGMAGIWLVGGLFGILRLYAAYRLYLRFRHPFTTVLLSQIVVFLLVLNLFMLAATRQ